jgi:hypothetical protein
MHRLGLQVVCVRKYQLYIFIYYCNFIEQLSSQEYQQYQIFVMHTYWALMILLNIVEICAVLLGDARTIFMISYKGANCQKGLDP